MILLVSGIVLGTILPLSLFVYFQNKKIIQEKTLEVCKTVSQSLANLSTEELLMDETYEATLTATLRLRESNIQGLEDVFVINRDFKIVADLKDREETLVLSETEIASIASSEDFTLETLNKNEKEILRFQFPILIVYHEKKIRLGAVVFDFDTQVLYAPVQELRNSILVATVFLLFIGILIALYISYRLTLPITKLTEGAKIIGSGDLHHTIEIPGKDEIAELSESFNSMTERIRDFTENLENKVKERTQELKESLETVQKLKEAQDGDYYLISLLLEPLALNQNNSQTVKTDFYLEQKKKFHFKQWDSQIGGDICITETIYLEGKEYVVFVNADAMGKSIQGAGGALVLGVVTIAGLIRSKVLKESNLCPELWLKERFLDLQSVFISFDGTMYISMVMGLVDSQTGFMYYVNFEHPWTILYRDEKASFIETENSLRKIGSPYLEERFHVKTFRLFPGDSIFVGSDGRDDLIIGNEDGIDIINEDESIVLNCIESAKGDLQGTIQEIKKKGEIYDDLSLMKIDVLDLPEPTPLKNPSSLEERWAKEPWNSEILLSLAEDSRKNKNLSQAILYRERFFLRKRNHIPNLVQLAKVYQQSKNKERANYYLRKAMDQDPENPDLVQIWKSIHEPEKGQKFREAKA